MPRSRGRPAPPRRPIVPLTSSDSTFVDVATAHSLHAAGEALILDIREREEWQAGHIDGAVHIPLGEIGARLDEIGKRAWLTVCRNGTRSDRVSGYLRDNGRDVRIVRGGMRAWADAGLPYSATNGDPGEVI